MERVEMNNDALVAALGIDAVAAVQGYRLQVIFEAERRGLCLVSAGLSSVVRLPDGACRIVDPIDIRLLVIDGAGHIDPPNVMLIWNPEHGWSLATDGGLTVLSYYAGPDACPSDLVPAPPQVLDWALGGRPGQCSPPTGVELDDDSEAISRLLRFTDPILGAPLPDALTPHAARPAEDGR